MRTARSSLTSAQAATRPPELPASSSWLRPTSPCDRMISDCACGQYYSRVFTGTCSRLMRVSVNLRPTEISVILPYTNCEASTH